MNKIASCQFLVQHHPNLGVAACTATAAAATAAAHFDASSERGSASNNYQAALAIARNTHVAAIENARIRREITIANCPCICPK